MMECLKVTIDHRPYDKLSVKCNVKFPVTYFTGDGNVERWTTQELL